MEELKIQADEVIYLEGRFKEAIKQSENIDCYLELLSKAYLRLNDLKEILFGSQILGIIYKSKI